MCARYVRDEILSQGLDLAACPTVLQHDMTDGIINENAWSIKWLQNALDMFHKKYPFSSDIQSVSMTLAAGSTDLTLTSDSTKYLPTDFILDVRNGLITSSETTSYRLTRKSFQYWLSLYNASSNLSSSSLLSGGIYTIVNNRFKIAPIFATAQTLLLWYYALPPLLTPTSTPNFPDEWSLIEFIRLKALEWTRGIEIGTAQLYLQKELARFKASGLLNDSEYDAIPLENNQVLLDGNYAWLGEVIR